MSIGKMKKHKQLLKRPALRRFLPETHWYSRATMLQMARFYSSVFIKPDQGTGGTGIIRAKKLRKGYEVRCGKRRKYVGMRSLSRAIKSFQKPSERYLVQRGLRLAKYNGTIFDVRIYMQKPDAGWVISGMAARVAAPNRIVTNYHKGGHGKPLYQVLLSTFHNNSEKVYRRLSVIKAVSYAIANTLAKRFPSIRELGIDLGIDRKGRIWIIEANSRPGHKLFTQLPDSSMYHTIMRNKHLIRTRNS